MASKDLKGITYVINGNTVGLDKAIAGVDGELKDLGSELRSCNRLLKLDPSNVTILKQKQDLLNRSITETKDKLKTLQDAQSHVAEQFQNGNIGQEQYEAFQREIEKTEQKLQSLEKQARTTGSILGTTIDNAGKKVSGAGQKISDVGQSLMPVSAVVAGVGAAAIKVGDDFESSMSRVAAISGATGKDFDALRAQAIQLGQDTAFSANEVAQGMENLASAGFSTKEIMVAMPGMLNLAASSGEDLASASDICASTLRGFGLAAGDAGHVADVLAKTSADTNAQMSDLGEAMKYIAPVASSAGWSLEQTAAAIGEMSNAGIKGEQAGTTLRGALTNLMNPSTQAAKAMQSIGFSAYDSQGKMKPLSTIIADLNVKTKGLSDQQRDNVISTIMGTNALSGMQVLLKSGSGSLNTLTASLQNSDGAAKNMANTMQGNTTGAIEQMKGSLETAAIKIQTALAPSITKAAKGVEELADKFSKLSSSQQQAIVKIAGIVAIAAPALIIIGKMTTGIGAITSGIGKTITAFANFKKAFTGIASLPKALSAALTPAGAVVAAIIAITAVVALLVVGIKHLWDTNEGFRNTVTGIWNGLKTLLQGIGSWFAGPFTNFFRTGFNAVKGIWQGAPGFFTGIWNGIKTGVNTIKGAFVNAFNGAKTGSLAAFNGLKTGLTTIMAGVKTGLTTAWNAIKSVLTAIIQPLVKGILDFWRAIQPGLSNIMNGVKSVLTGIWNVIKNAVLGIVLIICDLITGDFGKLGSDLSGIWNGIKNGAIQIWTGLQQFFSGILQVIVGIFTTAWTHITTNITAAWNGIKNITVAVWNGISQYFTGLWQSITTGLTTAWNNIVNFFKTTFTNIKNTVTNAWNGIANFLKNPSVMYNAITNAWNSAINWIKSLPGKAAQWAKDFINKYAGPLKNPALISNAIHGAMDTALDWLKNLPKNALQWGKDLIGSFVDGIKSKFEDVKDAIRGVGDNIRHLLHFSEPDEGPLADFHTWMPDMMEGIRTGILSNLNRVRDAATQVGQTIKAGIPSDLSLNIGASIAGINGLKTATATAGSSYSYQNNTPVNLNINMGDIVIKGNADQTALNKIRESQQKQINELKKWQNDFEEEMRMLPLQAMQWSNRR